MNTALYLILAHFLADFPFQSRWLVTYKKSHFAGVALHGLTHLVTSAVLLLPFLKQGKVWIGIGLIQLYRYSLSAILGRQCRHLPTCSQFAEDALARHGLWAGGWMSLARILRCNPWGSFGFDPVPGKLPQRACWYLPWR